MTWSVRLLIMMIYGNLPTHYPTRQQSTFLSSAFESFKPEGNTSSAHSRLSPCASIVGQPSYIQFLLSSDPELEKKDLHVWKMANGASKRGGPNKEDFILEGVYNRTRKDLQFYVQKGYRHIWNRDELILTIFIEKVGPEHEGAYVAECSNSRFHSHLKVLDAPPSTPAPGTPTDSVKDSCAADEHKEDCKIWQKAFWGVVAVLITLVVGMVVLGIYYIRRTTPAASRKKTGKRKTIQDDSSGHDETTDEWKSSGTPSGDNNCSGQDKTNDGWNASGRPSGDSILLLREAEKQRDGQQSSGEGCSSSSVDASSDHHTGDHSTKGRGNTASSSTPLLGKQDIKERLQGPGKATAQMETQDSDFRVKPSKNSRSELVMICHPDKYKSF